MGLNDWLHAPTTFLPRRAGLDTGFHQCSVRSRRLIATSLFWLQSNVVEMHYCVLRPGKAVSTAGPALGPTHHFVQWVPNLFLGSSDQTVALTTLPCLSPSRAISLLPLWVSMVHYRANLTYFATIFFLKDGNWEVWWSVFPFSIQSALV